MMTAHALRRFLAAGVLAVAAAATVWWWSRPTVAQEITVYKSPTCGCCNKWVTHLEQHGFSVAAHDVADVNRVKAQLGVPPTLGSCHTAVVGGYVIEGHVPADLIARLLAQPPAVAGVAVPGM